MAALAASAVCAGLAGWLACVCFFVTLGGESDSNGPLDVQRTQALAQAAIAFALLAQIFQGMAR